MIYIKEPSNVCVYVSHVLFKCSYHFDITNIIWTFKINLLYLIRVIQTQS